MVAQTQSDYDLSLLWREYKKVRSTNLRNRLVEAYLEFVKRVLINLMKKGFANFIDVSEIVAAGNFGLIQAVERFDPERGIKFEMYAIPRIRGAMLDCLRRIDRIYYKVRHNAQLYEKAESELWSGLGEKPTLQEIAHYLHVSEKEAQKLQRDAKKANTRFRSGIPALDRIPDKKSLQPFNEFAEADAFNNLIICLTVQERNIITLYYRYGYTIEQVGRILRLSQSRISQCHRIALQKIKKSFLRKHPLSSVG